MADTIAASQSIGSNAAPPNRVLKRKAVKDSDMFTKSKRIKYDANRPAYGEMWQQKLQKARDEIVLRPDELSGVIVPPEFLPVPKVCKWSKKVSFDDTRTRKWASLNKDKMKVKKNKHITEEVRSKALARFPMMEARKKEAIQDEAKARKALSESVEARIEQFRQRIEELKKDPASNDLTLFKMSFLRQCWKNLNYAIKFQSGPLEYEDMTAYAKEFVSRSHYRINILDNFADLATVQAMGFGTEEGIPSTVEERQVQRVLGLVLGME